MNEKRLHKVVLGGSLSAGFLNQLRDRGNPVPPLNQQAKLTAADHHDYSEVCLECHRIEAQKDGPFPGLPFSMLILRGTVACACCCAPCYGAGHGDRSGALAGVLHHMPTMEPTEQGYRRHGPGKGYCEAVVDVVTLKTLWDAATAGSINGSLQSLGAEIAAKSAEIGLNVADLDTLADRYYALDAASVFSGASTMPESYFWALALVVLWQRALYSAHRILSRDWPQRTAWLKPR
ncbi:MAG: hypothetical protein L0Z53_05495 [Acidobacteriales bacterium]|nr:hypothetical protein [Terriglobales bacterium]